MSPTEKAIAYAKKAETSGNEGHALLARTWALIAIADQLDTANYLANGGAQVSAIDVGENIP